MLHVSTKISYLTAVFYCGKFSDFYLGHTSAVYLKKSFNQHISIARNFMIST